MKLLGEPKLIVEKVVIGEAIDEAERDDGHSEHGEDGEWPKKEISDHKLSWKTELAIGVIFVLILAGVGLWAGINMEKTSVE